MSRDATYEESEELDNEQLLRRATVAGPLMRIREETETSFTLNPFRHSYRQYLRVLRHHGMEINFGICTPEACQVVDEYVEAEIAKERLFQKRGDDEHVFFEFGFVKKAQEEILNKLPVEQRSVIEETLDRFYELYLDATPQKPILNVIPDRTFMAPKVGVAHA